MDKHELGYDSMNKHRTTPYVPKSVNHKREEAESVDSWIDRLGNISDTTVINRTHQSSVCMQMLVQQRLPRVSLEKFDGAPEKWIDFVMQFYESVHSQPYLTDNQKKTYLLQHLKGEPYKAVEGFSNDTIGYHQSLKRLKYMFGQRPLVSHAVITAITKGKQLKDSDAKGISDLYYSLSKCRNVLTKMNYHYELQSSDVLRRVIRRLPSRLMYKWGEYQFRIRQHREPTLVDLENWLQERVMIMKDPYTAQAWTKPYHAESHLLHTNLQEKKTKSGCTLCDATHQLFKCDVYLKMEPKERLKLIKTEKRCFNCLGIDHGVKTCRSRHKCFSKDCHMKHHTTLHQALNKPRQRPHPNVETKPEDTSSENQQGVKHVGYNETMKKRVYLQVVPVNVSSSNGKSLRTYALLDGGSQCTILRKSLSKQLRLRESSTRLCIGTITDKGRMENAISVNFNLSSEDGSFNYAVKGAYLRENDKFNVPDHLIPNQLSQEQQELFQRFKIADVKSSDIGILLGADCAQAIICTEIKSVAPNLPHLAKTRFGWSLFGTSSTKGQRTETITAGHLRVEDVELHQMVERFWKTESMGVEFNDRYPLSIQDRNILEMLHKETKLEENHYVVPMLLKDTLHLGNNYSVAKRRLDFLTKRFKKDENMHKLYKRNIDEYVDAGYATRLSQAEIETRSSKTWYLPHHGVVHPSKPGKIRTVFDAAARHNGYSLNDNLITGPDLLNSLAGILLRFRMFQFPIIADIKAMFHQVRLKPEDRQAVRFLWKGDLNGAEVEHYQMNVHIFGGRCSPCCASFALKKTGTDNLTKASAETLDAIEKDFYMDDLLKSVETIEQGKKLVLELCALLKAGGFHLTKFNSSSSEILSVLPPIDCAPSKKFNIDPTSEVEKTLGVKWAIANDQFTFNTDIKTANPTKRGVLRVTSSIFDPLGLLSPFVVRAKLLIQELWRKRLGWDENIGEDLIKPWEKWLAELSLLPTFQMPRWVGYSKGHTKNTQLHIFCDASELAFAAVAYIRIITDDGTCHCSLLTSKSRVAPIKKLTLPRLELQGAVLGIRLRKLITKEITLQLDQIIFWTDSTINLQYINSDEGRFKTFVCNRIAEIRRHSEPSQWHFVPGTQNPADIATRGSTLKELSSSLWKNGPEFLNSSELKVWGEEHLHAINQDDEELKASGVNCQMTSTNNNEQIIDFKRFSSWEKLVNVTSWVLRYLNKLRKKNRKSIERLTLEETNIGKIQLLRLIQTEFNKEKMGKDLKSLDVFVDKEGLIRVGGRLKHSILPYAAKHQVVLPYKNYAVKLLIEHQHRLNMHWGQDLLLSTLRQTYWIIKGRSFVRSVIRSCLYCRKKKAPTIQPKMADLPPTRLAIMSPPFFNTGVDCFGPFNVKILRSRAKRWGCIFTCMTTRAVHLEVVECLSTDAFIQALERFINRRGYPQSINSDCGTNFVGADNELRQWFSDLHKDENVMLYAKRKEIHWNFNPPCSPHMGGVWERLVRSVKTSLKTILGGVVVNDFTLSTLLTEVECMLNSRPLTTISDDINDLEPLTPSHFLVGRANMNLVPTLVSVKQMDDRKRWKQVQALTTQFWQRWMKEYVPTITTRSKWYGDGATVKAGEVVVLKEMKTEKGVWPIVRITKVHTGTDGIIRSVDIKTKDGTYHRPLNKLGKLF